MTRVLNWGILGCGDVTEVKSGPGFARAPRSALAMVMRRDGARAEDYARRHGVPAWTDDAEALIDDPRVDAVYIATPPDSHAEYACRVAAAGKPVLVEKPLAHSLAAAEAVVAGCAGVPLFCAYYRRDMPRFVRVREIVASGRLGPLSSVEIVHRQTPPDGPYAAADLPWRLAPGAGDGGIFADMGSHMINLVEHVVGEVAPGSVSGRAENCGGFYPVVDHVEAAFTAGGVPVRGLWSYVAGDAEDRVTVTGEAGRLDFAVFTPTPLELTLDGATEAIAAPYPDHVHEPMIAAITDAILAGGATAVSGDAALGTARIQARILAG